MKLSETAAFMGKMYALYPSAAAQSMEEAKTRTAMWHSYYGEVPYDIMCEALKIYAQDNRYMPDISSVKKILGEMYSVSADALFMFECEKDLTFSLYEMLGEDEELYPETKKSAEEYSDPDYKKQWRMHHEYIIAHTKRFRHGPDRRYPQHQLPVSDRELPGGEVYSG